MYRIISENHDLIVTNTSEINKERKDLIERMKNANVNTSRNFYDLITEIKK